MNQPIDLVGRKFGRLEVKERDLSKFDRGVYWLCDCECGYKNKSVFGGHLCNGSIKSCGCICKRNRWTGYEEIPGNYWYSCKNSAKVRGLDFNITIEYIWEIFLKQNKQCALTGRILSFGTSHRKRDKTASLDRIDSSKGYVEGNVCWLHKDINLFKGKMHSDDFVKLSYEIVKYQEELRSQNPKPPI